MRPTTLLLSAVLLTTPALAGEPLVLEPDQMDRITAGQIAMVNPGGTHIQETGGPTSSITFVVDPGTRNSGIVVYNGLGGIDFSVPTNGAMGGEVNIVP